MDLHDTETIVKHLVAISVHQDSINDDLRTCVQRLTDVTERIDVTLAAIKDLLQRGRNGH